MNRKTPYAQECATKAKRAALGARLQTLAALIGVECEIKPQTLNESHGLTFYLAKGPYKTFGNMAGNSNVGAFLAHWHIDAAGKTAVYPKHFGALVRGTVNPFHWRKATTCADTFDDLAEALRNGFNSLDQTTA